MLDTIELVTDKWWTFTNLEDPKHKTAEFTKQYGLEGVINEFISDLYGIMKHTMDPLEAEMIFSEVKFWDDFKKSNRFFEFENEDNEHEMLLELLQQIAHHLDFVQTTLRLAK
ncbi:MULTISPECIES: hypothetical protein [Enterococcus]|uniref:Uncharacterized protein n=1 Tax=Enterococcus alishanensis TaxID=1303817 RepID=A0ABS6T8H0_9ENTE|nr:hypothetical protein [Enterococcus alishanensis]MBV7389208.1 hypothetical protein [Enterococcus alishanensis]